MDTCTKEISHQPILWDINDIAWIHIPSHHITSLSHYITLRSHHITSHHITSHHITSFHITSHHINHITSHQSHKSHQSHQSHQSHLSHQSHQSHHMNHINHVNHINHINYLKIWKKTSLTDLRTTSNQEMLAHLKKLFFNLRGIKGLVPGHHSFGALQMEWWGWQLRCWRLIRGMHPQSREWKGSHQSESNRINHTSNGIPLCIIIIIVVSS